MVKDRKSEKKSSFFDGIQGIYADSIIEKEEFFYHEGTKGHEV